MLKRVLAAAGIAAMAAGTATAASSNFDSYAEGFYGLTATFDGITVFDINTEVVTQPDGQQETPAQLGQEAIIETSVVVAPDFPAFTAGNTLTFGWVLVPGDNVTIGPLSTASFTTGQAITNAEFDLFFYDEMVWNGILVTTEALLNNTVVSTQSFTIVGREVRNAVTSRHITVTGVTFDTVRFRATLNGVPTTFRCLMDNISMGSATPPPCPANFDGSADGVQVADIFAFLSAWFAGTPASDFNGNTTVNEVADIFAFLSAWFAGCP